MVDAIKVEQKGKPAVATGGELLLRASGRGAMIAHDFLDLKIARVPAHLSANAEAAHSPETLGQWADALVRQVIDGLTGRPMEGS